MDQTANLQMPYILPSQAQKHVTHNEALQVLDSVVQLAVVDRDLSSPPGTPQEGDRYIVAGAGGGVWAGHGNAIASFLDGAWHFLAPQQGWIAWVLDEATLVYFDGAVWLIFSGALPPLQDITFLGIGTTADAGNPFSAKLNNVLWTAKTVAEGGDGYLRFKFNKEASGDVLSLLMQTGFSGRAELGLIGDNDVTLKLSADGTFWTTALRLSQTGMALGDGFAPGHAVHVRRSDAVPARIAVEGGGAGVGVLLKRASTDAVGASVNLVKARGSITTPAAPQQNDSAGTLIWQADNGSETPRGVAEIAAQVIAPVPGDTDMQGRIVLSASPAASVTPSEIARLDAATGLSMFGANPVIDAARHFRLRSYTIASLPSASAAAGQMIWCSDLGGGAGALVSSGSVWHRLAPGGSQLVSTDANYTLTVLTSAENQRHSGPLTAARTITLSTTNAYAGARFRVSRTGTGAFNLSVGGLKGLAINQWAEAVYDGSAWYLAAFGSL